MHCGVSQLCTPLVHEAERDALIEESSSVMSCQGSMVWRTNSRAAEMGHLETLRGCALFWHH